LNAVSHDFGSELLTFGCQAHTAFSGILSVRFTGYKAGLFHLLYDLRGDAFGHTGFFGDVVLLAAHFIPF